jgi:hypothetical protein
MIPQAINSVRSRLMLLFHWRNIGQAAMPTLAIDYFLHHAGIAASQLDRASMSGVYDRRTDLGKLALTAKW